MWLHSQLLHVIAVISRGVMVLDKQMNEIWSGIHTDYPMFRGVAQWLEFSLLVSRVHWLQVGTKPRGTKLVMISTWENMENVSFALQ